MANKDHTKYFSALGTVIPNTVSRDLKMGDRSFGGAVFQSGKPVLDAELNALQDLLLEVREQLRQSPSGFLRGQNRADPLADFSYFDPALPSFVANALKMSRREAVVAGFPVVVEYTGTANDNENILQLQAPQIYDGTPNTVKRTDFVFLEVWQALVAPSPRASGTVQIFAPNDGDTITIDGVVLTAKATPTLPTDFQIQGTDPATALALQGAILANITTVAASYNGTDTLLLTAVVGGVAGNAIGVSTSNPAAFLLSGPFLTGGADRPNKPAQDKLYRHGNTQSDSATWLPDDLVDPLLQRETCQRVQIQYRIRTTGTTEAVNFKSNPDGFSAAQVYAQGAVAAPVSGYPFVPADGISAAGSSDAGAYGVVDSGLWIAGAGDQTSALALETLDGFVYAIPLGLFFRRNNCSDPTAAIKGFDPLNNTNGGPMQNHVGYTGVLGVIPAGVSDRPDRSYADAINGNDILDLRKHITLTGVDLASELRYQLQCLMDGKNFTWAVDTVSKQELGGGSGDVSTRNMVCNEIGRRAAQGGNPPDTGDTDRGVTIRNFDHIARRFADQPIIERLVVGFYPGDRYTGSPQGLPVSPGQLNDGKYVVKAEIGGTPITTGTWYADDELHLELDKFDATTQGSIWHGGSWATSGGGLPNVDLAAFFPPGTVISDILSIYHDDGNWTAAIDQTAQARIISGIGTNHVVIQLDRNDLLATGGLNAATYKLTGSAIPGPDNASPRRIFVEFEVTYPLGVGLTDTPDQLLLPDLLVWPEGALLENNVTQRGPDLNTPLHAYREGYREVCLQSITGEQNDRNSMIGANFPEAIVSRDTTTLIFPRRVYKQGSFGISVEDAETTNVKTVDDATSEYGSSSRIVNLSGAPLSGAQTLCNVEYFALDPVANYGAAGSGYQISIYYRTNAPQTAGVKEGNIIHSANGVLPATLRVEPLAVLDQTWTGQVGMGSADLPYPYVAPLDQIPVNDGTAPDPGFVAGTTFEWFFAATTDVSVADFNAGTGLLALHNFVTVDGSDILEFGGSLAGQFPVKDAEFRAFYPFVDLNNYRPTAMAQPLTGATRHKNFTALLARITENVFGVASGGLLFRKNEVVLIVLSRLGELDEANEVLFKTTNNRTCAGVYKTRSLLMVNGD